MEKLQSYFDSISQLREILCGVALILVAITALAVMLKANRETAVTRRIWDKVGNRMELAGGKLQFPLVAEEVLIGRHGAADIRIPDLSISRYHALLTVSDGIWTITDLNSAGGTFVNGKRVKCVRLRENDRIHIGGTTLCLRRRV